MIKLKPTDNFSAYVAQRKGGASPEAVLATMKGDGLDAAARMRGIRFVFRLDFQQASQVMAGGPAQLDAQRAAVLQGLATLDAGG